jgi:hypothetical protein
MHATRGGFPQKKVHRKKVLVPINKSHAKTHTPKTLHALQKPAVRSLQRATGNRWVYPTHTPLPPSPLLSLHISHTHTHTHTHTPLLPPSSGEAALARVRVCLPLICDHAAPCRDNWSIRLDTITLGLVRLEGGSVTGTGRGRC